MPPNLPTGPLTAANISDVLDIVNSGPDEEVRLVWEAARSAINAVLSANAVDSAALASVHGGKYFEGQKTGGVAVLSSLNTSAEDFRKTAEFIFVGPVRMTEIVRVAIANALANAGLRTVGTAPASPVPARDPVPAPAETPEALAARLAQEAADAAALRHPPTDVRVPAGGHAADGPKSIWYPFFSGHGKDKWKKRFGIDKFDNTHPGWVWGIPKWIFRDSPLGMFNPYSSRYMFASKSGDKGHGGGH